MKKFLREHANGLYQIFKRTYHGIRYGIEMYLLGTRIQEWSWKTRHIYKGQAWADIYSSSENQSHPYRKTLIEKIAEHMIPSHKPKVLEIGCASGQNLYSLSKKFPTAELTGIDINAALIKKGNEYLKEHHNTAISLKVGRADDIGTWPDKYFDIVFTSGLLIYIGPDKIEKIIQEILRITKKTTIFLEIHAAEHLPEDPAGLGVYASGNYKRNYIDLIKRFTASTIMLTKLAPTTAHGDAPTHFIIEVDMSR
jgi:ubiquinone/menaquinone biosynthesis C-methylase UbiE